MTRHLLLVRHAKSAWDDPLLSDHDRPLAGRGQKALPRICEHLEATGLCPELVLCSSAQRTVETLAGVRTAVPEAAVVEIDNGLYLADAEDLIARLRGIDPGIGCVMVIGHNPGLQDLSLRLVGDGGAEDRSQIAAKLPTGAVVTLSFDADWALLGPGVARLDDLFLPRRPRS